jgi:hypothetical protein
MMIFKVIEMRLLYFKVLHVATIDLIKKPSVGRATKVMVSGLTMGVGFIPVFGWGISLRLTVVDMMWGG